MSWWWQFRAALSVAWLAFITSYRQERAEQRLRVARGGFACSAVISNGVMQSGVAALTDPEPTP